MSRNARAVLVESLRAATPFDIPIELIAACLTASEDLVNNPERLAAIEAQVQTLLLHATPLPSRMRAAARPVLGNIAEAIVESILVDAGWSPLEHDIEGISFGHGVDLLMLDAAAERVVAIEVKSTVQKDRWPRLARGGAEQLTPEWLDRAANIGMRDLGLDSTDVYVMVVQLHFVRQQWRACLGTSALTALPVITMEQLDELGWVL